MEKILNTLAKCYKSRASIVITFLVLMFVVNMGNPKVGEIIEQSLIGSLMWFCIGSTVVILGLLFWKGKVWTKKFFQPAVDFFSDGRLGTVFVILVFLLLLFLEDKTFFAQSLLGIKNVVLILGQLALYAFFILLGFSYLLKGIKKK